MLPNSRMPMTEPTQAAGLPAVLPNSKTPDPGEPAGALFDAWNRRIASPESAITRVGVVPSDGPSRSRVDPSDGPSRLRRPAGDVSGEPMDFTTPPPTGGLSETEYQAALGRKQQVSADLEAANRVAAQGGQLTPQQAQTIQRGIEAGQTLLNDVTSIVNTMINAETQRQAQQLLQQARLAQIEAERAIRAGETALAAQRLQDMQRQMDQMRQLNDARLGSVIPRTGPTASSGMPVWGYILIAIGAAGLVALVVWLIMRAREKRTGTMSVREGREQDFLARRKATQQKIEELAAGARKKV